MKLPIGGRILLHLAVGLLASLTPLQIAAHGSGIPKLVEVPAGPYVVTAWLSPAETRAGQTMHVTVGIKLPGETGDEPVLDAEIELQIVAFGMSEPIMSVKATTEQSVNKLLYETDIMLDKAGDYTILILVRSPAGEGETSFDIELQPAAANGTWGVTTAVVIGLLAMAGLAVRLLRKRTLSANESQDISAFSK